MQSQSFAGFAPAAVSRPPTLQPAGHRSGEGASTALAPLHDDNAGRAVRTDTTTHDYAGTVPPGISHAVPPSARRIGKFLVSPLIKSTGDGWFASSVSIRSGSGSATTDRVLRLTQVFRCETEAAVYAHEEALHWIGNSRLPQLASVN